MKVIKKLVIIAMFVIISIGMFFGFKGYNMYKEAIKQETLDQKFTEIKEKKNYTSLAELPKIYLEAVISVEDHRFYNHCGIDIIAIGRSTFNDIRTMSFAEGGSTITQQLAKNTYFTQEKKVERKIAEIFMAFDIEKNYSKDEILELYVNTAYYGSGYNTPKEASKGYFGKLPNDMTDGECIMLAGVPNAPSVYNPKANRKLAKQRQKQVANKMIEYGYLTKEKANEILSEK